MSHTDTIVALGSPIASALRAIVRVSGERAFELVETISRDRGKPLEHARAIRRPIEVLPGLVFEADIYSFCGPRSATGEDITELHFPASPFLVACLLKRLIECGARQAEPGEFTARGFFNGKLDLTAAEGVAATIAASNRAELDAARQLLGGELARRLRPALDELVSTLALVEIGIDFTDEDVTFLSRPELDARLQSVRTLLSRLVEQSPRIERLSREPRIVLAGRPNAGKSTLLNALAGRARAVVSEVEGTTRDALSAEVALPRGFITIVDVAGLCEADDDAVSTQMQSISASQIETADAVVLLVDPLDPRPRVALPRQPDLVVFTKLDLASPPEGELGIDALHGHEVDTLRARLDEIAFGGTSASATSLALNARHVAALEQAIQGIDHAQTALPGGSELVASELRGAINHLGSILGTVSADDVLGKIFSSFCIGK